MAETMVASSVKSDHSTRKNKKPLMEKRRRARINSCLTQLKSLVLQAIKKDSSQFSKLEKADILELTVKHLRALQRQQAAGVMSQDTVVVSKYRAGFNECAKEVVRYMGSVREVNEEVKERVVGHLANCLQMVNQITPMESLQQQQMKPLHVHIPPPPPPQQPTTVTAGGVSSVIMHTAAVSQPMVVGGGSGFVSTSPLRPPTTTTTANQDCRTHVSALPLTTAAVVPTSMVSTVSSSLPGGAFKLVPSGSGTVAVYVGTCDSMPRAPGGANVSVDAVPLYSVALPPTPTPLAAYVTTPVTSECRYEDLSPVKAEFSPLHAACLPVDLRQTSRGKSLEENFRCPYSSSSSSPLMAGGHCSPAIADDKLWRPW
ncbi:hypothetical protein ACOMHN_010214 [Nucella lapillus]